MTQVFCIILAGGLGTRIRSVLGDLPKCLAPIGSKTFLSLLISNLRTQGFHNIALSLGHGSEKVSHHAKELSELNEISLCCEPQPLGTGGAILFAMDALGLDEAIVVNGDTFLEASADSLCSALRLDSNELIRMLGVKVDNVERFGSLCFDSLDRLTGFREKGWAGPGYINAGYYRITRKVFGNRKPGEVFSLEVDILTPMINKGAVSVEKVDGYFTDIGIPEDYQAFCSRSTLV